MISVQSLLFGKHTMIPLSSAPVVSALFTSNAFARLHRRGCRTFSRALGPTGPSQSSPSLPPPIPPSNLVDPSLDVPQLSTNGGPEISADLTPLRIVEELNRHIVGQQPAKKALAIALRNRWRRLRLSSEMREEVLPKCCLLIGSSGRLTLLFFLNLTLRPGFHVSKLTHIYLNTEMYRNR